MCFDTDSLPPIPVLSGGAVTHEDLVLESGDGTRFAAFAALPDEASSAGVVILPDVRGLYRFYEELALRFAERGYAAVAIDYFGRTAGVEKRGDDFEYPPHVEQTTPEGVQADTAAAVAWLRERGLHVDLHRRLLHGRPPLVARRSRRPRPRAERSASTAVRAKAATARPARHRSPTGSKPRSSPCKRAPTRTSRAEDNAAFKKALESAGVEHELVEYEGAPHSFFDRKQEDFADASADAWQRTLDFIEPTEADIPPAPARRGAHTTGEAATLNRATGPKSEGLAGKKSEGPGRQSGPRFSFLSRAGYGLGSRPPGVGPTMGGMGCHGEEPCRPSFTSIVFFVPPW